jgi:hypothetical protein
MKTKQFMAIALALGLTAWSAAAQNDGPAGPGPQGPPPGENDGPPDGPPPGGRRHRPPPIMEVLDTNHDGIISAEEIANAPKALQKLVKRADGKLTLAELFGPPPGPPPGGPDGDQAGPNGDQPPPPPPDDGNNGAGKQGNKRRHPPIPPLFAALDTDGDGVLSPAEIANASKSLLKLDKNGDGKLTPDEYRPQRPPPRDGGPNNNN